MSERFALHLERPRESATQAQSYLQGMTREAFLADRRTQQAVVLNLLVIGETVNRLHDKTRRFLNDIRPSPGLPCVACATVSHMAISTST